MSRLNSYIVGTLLGDSYIRVVHTTYKNTGNVNGPYYEIRCEQVTPDLIEAKKEIWQNVFQREARIYKRQRKPAIVNGGKFESVFKPVSTLVIQHKDVFDYYKLFYLNGKKTVTAKTLFHLDERGIAHWIMDDGLMTFTESNNTRRLTLCTDGFDKFSCKLIAQYFSEKYQLSAKIQERKTAQGVLTYRVKFGGKDMQKLSALVFPYMLESFYYKIFAPYEMLDTKRVIPEYREIYDTLYKVVSQRKAGKLPEEIV
jgi:hypothetical protein